MYVRAQTKEEKEGGGGEGDSVGEYRKRKNRTCLCEQESCMCCRLYPDFIFWFVYQKCSRNSKKAQSLSPSLDPSLHAYVSLPLLPLTLSATIPSSLLLLLLLSLIIAGCAHIQNVCLCLFLLPLSLSRFRISLLLLILTGAEKILVCV